MVPAEEDPARGRRDKLLPVMVIAAAHSRFMVGAMIPTRHTEDLLLAMWMLLQLLGRVPRRLIPFLSTLLGRALLLINPLLSLR